MSVSDQTIIRTPNPKGTFINCIIDGTPKPGTCMQIKAATAAVGGRMTYEVAAPGGDGQRALMAILVEDSLQGKTVSDAYVTGTNATLYCPVPGEELNILFNNVSGTADDVAIGDLLILDNGTGKFNVTTGTVESEPFQALEAITDPTADTLLAAIFTGQ
jgi:hypothetical protein